jgi:enhancing lycopene biosynthesis protein 2
VLLAGSGVYDGSEITEAVSLLVGLSRLQAEVKCFAPNTNQAHVVDHTTGEEDSNPRNTLKESARIARGAVTPIEELRASDFDALFVPGGFGAAKNLCDFGFKGAEMQVYPSTQSVLEDFKREKKVIALSCIAPILAAKAFGNCEITLGKETGENWPYAGSSGAAKSFGARHKECEIHEVCVDPVNRIVTVPAYMKGDAKPHEVADSMELLVQTVSKMIK